MNIIKKIFSGLFVMQFLFAIRAEYTEAYYVKNNPYVLCRPKMNYSNDIISSELYTTTADYRNGENNNGIIFFKRSNSENYKLHNGLDDITKTIIACNAGLVSWSVDKNKPWFYAAEQEGNQYGQENITFGNILAINPSESDMSNIIKQKKGYFDIDGLIIQQFTRKQNKSLYDDKKIIKKMLNVNDVDVSKVINLRYLPFKAPRNSDINDKINQFPDRLFYLYRDTLNAKILKSNAPNYVDNNGIVLPKVSIKSLLSKEERYEDTLKLKLSIADFDIVQKYRKDWSRTLPSYNIVIQENGGDYQNRIYFLCHTEGQANDFIPLYASAESERASQIEPLFNYNGDKIAFLSQKQNKLYDLYVVDISECSNCNSFIDGYSETPLDLEYIKIDTDIVSVDNWLDLQNFNSYCWHPSENILFYIKKELDNQNEDTYPIYYYDLTTMKNGKVENIVTEFNKYPSISNDGQYLLFSFSGTMSGVNNKNYSFRNSNEKEIHYNRTHSIGVAKLIYD